MSVVTVLYKGISGLVLMFLVLSQAACISLSKQKSINIDTNNEIYYSSFDNSGNVKNVFSLPGSSKVIVLAASERGDKKLLSQLAVLNDFKSETYIYVLASSHILRRDGYYMDKPSSERFLNGKDFRVVFYDKRGVVITESTSVVNGKKLATFLNI